MHDPTKKVALVTGANKGIGREIAHQFGKAGMIVLLGARDTVLGETAAAKLREEKLDVHFYCWTLCGRKPSQLPRQASQPSSSNSIS